MLYNELLATTRACPFCDYDTDRIIKKEKNAFLTYSLAPYCKHHLLVIPYRHIENYDELENEEKKDMDELLTSGIKYLKSLGHEGYSLLLRNGKSTGKSVDHLHYHIIPTIEIGSLVNNNIDRIVMSDDEIKNLLEEFKKLTETN